MRSLLLLCRLLLLLVPASAAHAAWLSFQIIEWQPRNEAQLRTLRTLGVTAVAVVADRDGAGTQIARQTAAPRNAALAWYIENIATDFYSPYHRYYPAQQPNWRFSAAQRRYRTNPDDPAALFRDPSLLDPLWQQRIHDRLTATVRQQRHNRPLYYSLGDETGIADLAAFWDFDLSPPSVAGFRTWLHSQYGSLAALNVEWGTGYANWNAVQPETTRAAMQRSDGNFAPWSDFKAWMDTSFANALQMGTDAVHRADPHALSAIEGVQIPGWGGYDYAKLAHTVDLMEVYDSDENIPLLRAFNPALIPLITSFGASPADLHAIWRSVLRGARGLILWDEDHSIVRADASEGPRAQAYAQIFAALHGELGRRLLVAQPVYDPVAILYSPASFRITWMLEHRHAGDAWMNRSAASEWQDNPWRAALRDYAEALARMALHPRFVDEAQLANLQGVAALILPHSLALSDQAARAIAAFAARGGVIIADTPPGQFDGHGRRRNVAAVPARIVLPQDLPQVLTLPPAFATRPVDVESWLFRSGKQCLLALQRRAPGGTPEAITVDLHGRDARDIASGRDYRRQQLLGLTLDPVMPIVLETGCPKQR